MFPAESIADAIFSASRRTADRPALPRVDRTALGFGRMADLTAGRSAALLARGVRRGERIAFLVPRGPLGVIGFLAVSAVGTSCPLSPSLRPDELAASLLDRP